MVPRSHFYFHFRATSHISPIFVLFTDLSTYVWRFICSIGMGSLFVMPHSYLKVTSYMYIPYFWWFSPEHKMILFSEAPSSVSSKFILLSLNICRKTHIQFWSCDLFSLCLTLTSKLPHICISPIFDDFHRNIKWYFSQKPHRQFLQNSFYYLSTYVGRLKILFVRVFKINSTWRNSAIDVQRNFILFLFLWWTFFSAHFSQVCYFPSKSCFYFYILVNFLLSSAQ